jgi:ribosomal protein S18 acetylase RimI-like enzyme
MIEAMRPDDWELMRDIRLRALADAPFAFSSTHAAERDRPESFWRSCANWSAPRGAAFVAVEEGRAIALAGVYVDRADPSLAHLISMWVEPAARGRGLGRALVDRAIAWASQEGAARLELWVTETNGAALRLYESCGFALTGEREPFPPDPSLEKLVMRRPL